MGSFAAERRTFFYNLKRYGFTLSNNEIKQIGITVVIIAFIWSFNKWGGATFDFIDGMKNFAIGAIFALIALVFNQVGQRVIAVHYGYDPSYEYGILGLMIGLVITFASRGYIVFFFPGIINLRHLAASRLGEFRYYTNDWEWAKACFMGPFFNILLAIAVSPFKDIIILRHFMVINILFAVYSLMPMPGNVGLPLLYPHLHFWFFTVGIVAAASAMVFFLPPLLTLALSFLVGAIMIYYTFFVWAATKDRNLP